MTGSGRRTLRLRRVPAGPAFATVFKDGKRVKDTFFLVCAHRNPLNHPRLGVNVGRKVSSRAVERNRIKRLVREEFRHSQQAITGLDIVVVAQAAAGGADRGTLRLAVKSQLMKIANLCRRS